MTQPVIPVATPPLPSKVTQVANIVLHYDIIAVGILTWVAANVPQLTAYGTVVHYTLYVLAGVAAAAKFFGAVSPVATATSVLCLFIPILLVANCTPAQQAAVDTSLNCAVAAYDASDAGTEAGKIAEATYMCRADEEALISTLAKRAKIHALDGGN